MKKICLLLIAFLSYSAIQSQTPEKITNPTGEGLEIGNIAPDLALPNPEGKTIKLSSLRGKVVLIDFWASWCGPCRMENPNVVTAYNKYKETKFKNATGFTVYGVSLDKTKEPWIKAIDQDHLAWPNHVSDLKWWYSDAARLYGVQSIPSSWLINEKGIIIGKNLRGPALDQALENLKAN